MDLTVITTYRCDSKCQMCYIWQNPTLPKEEISIETLKKLPSNFDNINISGGEPTLRKDLAEIVDVLVEDGDGVVAVNSYIRANRKRRRTMTAIKKVHQLVNPVDYQQLLEIGDIWVDAAFDISEKDLRTMSRLVRSQHKFAEQEKSIPLFNDNSSRLSVN